MVIQASGSTPGSLEVQGGASAITVHASGGQTGVQGEGSIYGVRGIGGTWAGYFTGNIGVVGNLTVTGTLTKTAGSFKIDHPQDPANKFLYHSFIESPDMKNLYDGLVTTGADGFATVELPTYFEALNKDFRYQLTVVGDGSWARARVFKKVDGGRFVIQTDAPNVEVSWQVTGIRQDAYANNNRIQVEVEKTGDERGTASTSLRVSNRRRHMS